MKSLCYKEHRDAFNTENIASSVLDKSYHVIINPVNRVASSNTGQDFESTVTLLLIFKGNRDMTEAMERAEKLSESVIKTIMSFDRLKKTGLKNVIFNSLSFDPFASSNDNVVRCTLVFEANYYLCY